MNDIERWRSEMLRLMGQGNPFLHQMAAARIIVQADICTCDEPEKRAALLDVMEIWMKTHQAMQVMMQKLSKDELPLIAMARKELQDDACSGDDDGEADASDDEEFPFATAVMPRPKRRRMKPSRVLAKGPWDPTHQRYWLKAFEDEDSLRSFCFYGPLMDDRGRVPNRPLLASKEREISGYGVWGAYKRGAVKRPWNSESPCGPDVMMIEDLIILLAAFVPAIPRGEWERRINGLTPFLRSSLAARVLEEADAAAVRLFESGVITSNGNGAWGLKDLDAAAVEVLARCWADPWRGL
jgi:hypothetical protein